MKDEQASSPLMDLRPRYRWRIPDRPAIDPETLLAAREHGIGPRLLAVLGRRGRATAIDIADLVRDPLDALGDPSLLPDAEPFQARVEQARARQERVLVFGDFDADGLTGLAILVLALQRLGIDAAPYVPDRLAEGHGLSLAAVERARVEGRTLIVTVDCGTASGEEITAAGALGIDVLVTDHHRVTGALPPAVAVVNPHRSDSRYPHASLTGAGVAFTLARLVLIHTDPSAALALADLALIGTVADVADVRGENRAIARLGLAALRGGPRPGLAALLASARVDPAAVDLETVAFALAPRLNAAGRVCDGSVAARLLLARDAGDAETLADELERANDQRRALTEAALAEARERIGTRGEEPAIVLDGPWPVGVIGLVAGRLAEEHRVPTLVVSTDADPWRGSARSPAGHDLSAMLTACADLLERYGGHTRAAGCNVRRERFVALRERFLGLAAAGPPPDPVPALVLDLALRAQQVDYALLHELRPLTPTGPGEPEPLIGIAELQVARVREANGGHAQLTLRKGLEVFDAIAFGRGDLVGRLAEGEAVEAVARLRTRTFGGFESLQLEIVDVGPPGSLAAARARPQASPASRDRPAPEVLPAGVDAGAPPHVESGRTSDAPPLQLGLGFA